MKELVLYHHLGLGDHFICNGLVNRVSLQAKVYLVCKEKNYKTVSCLYKDNNSVEVISVKNEPEDVNLFASLNKLPILQVGFKDFSNKTFDRSFYSELGLDFSLRYNNFKLPKVIENSEQIYNKIVTKTPYCLVHNICSDGEIKIDVKTDLEIVHIIPGLTDNLLDYAKVIQNAFEIHCIDSSVYHLIDSLDLTSRLYYHDVRGFFENRITVSDKWIKV